MAFIPYVREEEASSELKELYQRYRGGWGGVDYILKIHSLDPHSMETHYELYHHLMRGPGPLSRRQREMIAVTVSSLNHCFY